MAVIYSSTALRDRQREVKAAADREPVHITENGNGAYVFCSEEVFDREIEEAVEKAVHEARLSWAIERGLADVAAGRYVVGTEAARAEVARRRPAHG